MSTEENKAVVRRYLDEIINQGNIGVAEEIVAQDYINHTPSGGVGSGRADFIQGLVTMLTAFPDWHVTVEEMIAEGDLVVDQFRISATHTGSVNGIPASGRPIATVGMHMWRVHNGKLIEGWYTHDSLHRVAAALVPSGE